MVVEGGMVRGMLWCGGTIIPYDGTWRHFCEKKSAAVEAKIWIHILYRQNICPCDHTIDTMVVWYGINVVLLSLKKNIASMHSWNIFLITTGTILY